jgi:hypothetical protein
MDQPTLPSNTRAALDATARFSARASKTTSSDGTSDGTKACCADELNPAQPAYPSPNPPRFRLRDAIVTQEKNHVTPNSNA